MVRLPRNIPNREPLATRSRARAFGLACLLVASATGCSGRLPGKPNPADRPVPDDQAQSFDVLFRRNCAGCHGANGRLGPAPPLNDAIFLAIVPDTELLRVIQAGRRGTPMPAFARDRGGLLTEAQVSVLAAGIKPRWKSAENPTPKLADGLPGYLTQSGHEPPASRDVQLANSVFSRSCAGCHGAHGEQGKGKTRAGAIDDPAFLSLISDQALRRIIITGRPDFKMPNFADAEGRGAGFEPLTSAQIDELVTLLAQWRQGDSTRDAVREASNP